MSNKTDFKLFILWILLLVQLGFVIFYLLITSPPFYEPTIAPKPSKPHNFLSVTFVKDNEKYDALKQNFRTKGTKVKHITINKDALRDHFISINGTVCYTKGTDIYFMRKFYAAYSKKCQCKKGWHGIDCGQPEVIWRAFVASRQKIIPTKRSEPRKIIHGFPIYMETTFAEITIHELFDAVDLFIVCESNYTENGDPKPLYFYDKLRKGYLKSMQHKILYLLHDQYSNVTAKNYAHYMRKFLWKQSKEIIVNLKYDDLLVILDDNEIPNAKALMFFKLYDGWPQPIAFRLRWSVFGFYWQHPDKTAIVLGASTVQFLNTYYHNDPAELKSDTTSSSINYFVVGDLNHYGGWFCSWCLEPHKILQGLELLYPLIPPDWKKANPKEIDISRIEELISTGVWFDGKTTFIHRSQTQDSYFAPQYTLNNSWKYEYLLVNFYSNEEY